MDMERCVMIKRAMLIRVGILFTAVFIMGNLAAAAEHDFSAERVKQTIHWQNHVKNNPMDPQGHFELAMIYALTGRVEKGLAELNKIDQAYAAKVMGHYEPLVKNEPWDADHKFKLAFGYYFADRKAAAKAMFQRILDENNSQHVWAMGYKALVLGYEDKYDEVIALCQRALDIDPGAAGIWFLRGEAFRKKGETLKGASDMLKALRLRAQDEHAWKKLEREARAFSGS
jgi:tetratricopeptide (TPR) repeat protein